MTQATAGAETDLEACAGAALDWIRREAPGAQAELFLSQGRERSIAIRDGRLELIEESAEAGVGLRVLEGGRMGFAYGVGMDLPSVQGLFRRVREQLPHLPPDEHRVLPGPSASSAPAALAGTLTDASLFQRPIQEQLPVLRRLEAAAKAADRRVSKVLRVDYGEGLGEALVASTTGLLSSETGTHCNVSLAATAERGAEVQVAGGASMGRAYVQLDFDRAAADAAFRAASVLDGRKLPTGRRAVVFDPWVAGELLEVIAGMLSADQVQRGKSLLKGKIGKAVAAPGVTFVDDPWRPGGLGSGLFDGEGVPTSRKTMVEAGVLKDYFYDAYTAHKGGRAPSGSAGRGSFKGLPGPSSSNFYLAPGKTTREGLLADTKDGVLVLEIMGMHTADPVSGEFSVGVSGLAVEGGRLAGAVRGAMISGNILDLLGRIDAVADDLTFYGGLASPTFRVADMTVA